MNKFSRRKLLRASSGLVGAAAVTSALPDPAEGNPQVSVAPPVPDDLPEAHRKEKLKVVFVGAHTDDYTDCLGTLARYTAAGHEVLIVSCTPGDSVSMADVFHMKLDDLAALRRDQAAKGAEIMGGSPWRLPPILGMASLSGRAA